MTIYSYAASATASCSHFLSCNVLTVSLRRVIEETERNPRGFIFGRKPVPEGPGEVPDERQRR